MSYLLSVANLRAAAVEYALLLQQRAGLAELHVADERLRRCAQRFTREAEKVGDLLEEGER